MLPRTMRGISTKSVRRVVQIAQQQQQQQRTYSIATAAYDDHLEGLERKRVTLIPGDGVGPELTSAVKHVFNALGVPVDWEEVHVTDIGTYFGETSIDHVVKSIGSTKVALMGVLTSGSLSIKPDQMSINQNLRKELDLFASLVRCRSIPGIATRHADVDIVIVREQTEGEYSSLEHESVPGVIEMLKVVTRKKSERIARFAFDYALQHQRKKVTCVHKANIMKLGDGLFLDTCREVSKLYPSIEFEEMIVDNASMQLVSKPTQFDVILLPNLYGSIVSNISCGLVGGAGVVPGRSFGKEHAVFSIGARHTFAQKAGLNVANPTAMLLSSCSMLEHINLRKHGRALRQAVLSTIAEGKYVTMDLGGSASASVFTNRVIQHAQLNMK